MDRSFYQFIQTYADPHKKDVQTQFANLIIDDVAFPKQSHIYAELADYIELTDIYSQYTRVFDELWEVYVELNQNN